MSQDHGKEKEHLNRRARRNENQALHVEQVQDEHVPDAEAGEFVKDNIQTGAGSGNPLEDGSREGGIKERDDQDFLEG